jgi:hypothetical protein
MVRCLVSPPAAMFNPAENCRAIGNNGNEYDLTRTRDHVSPPIVQPQIPACLNINACITTERVAVPVLMPMLLLGMPGRGPTQTTPTLTVP